MRPISCAVALAFAVTGMAFGNGPALAQGANLCGTWDGKWDIPGRTPGGVYILRLSDCDSGNPKGETTAWVATAGKTETTPVTQLQINPPEVRYHVRTSSGSTNDVTLRHSISDGSEILAGKGEVETVRGKGTIDIKLKRVGN